MKAVTKLESSIARTTTDLLLFTSYSGTLWWYSNMSRVDELHACSLQLEGAHLPQMNFVDLSIHLGEWIDSEEDKRMTVPDNQSSVQP